MFKKIVSVLLCTLLLSAVLLPAASAATLPISAGLEKLQDQFYFGAGPSVGGTVIDYYAFAPENAGNGTKYPLVVWVHGLVSGGYPGRQITKNDISYWASAEFQARFPQGGAYILAPRSPEVVAAWADTMKAPLKAAIDSFIQDNYDSIDASRIYIGGLSVGGRMTLDMVAAYPDMFAAAFPCSPYYTGSMSSGVAEGCADTPVWMLSSKNDYLMTFSWITSAWNKLAGASNRKADCRWTVMDTALMPDGSRTGTTHDTWYAATYDMFMLDDQPFTGSVTYDGSGNVVTLTYPHGMISWLSGFSSDYSVAKRVSSDSFFTRIYKSIMAFFARIAKALGLRGILG